MRLNWPFLPPGASCSPMLVASTNTDPLATAHESMRRYGISTRHSILGPPDLRTLTVVLPNTKRRRGAAYDSRCRPRAGSAPAVLCGWGAASQTEGHQVGSVGGGDKVPALRLSKESLRWTLGANESPSGSRRPCSWLPR